MSTELLEAPRVANPNATNPTVHRPSPALPPSASARHQSADSLIKNQSTEEYLTFRLCGQEYGIDILKVQEIRSYEAPTKIANAPAYIKGVINLRGAIVPVVDLRIKFRSEPEYVHGSAIDHSVVIVLSFQSCVVGIMVDAVSDVIRLSPEAIQPPPALSSSLVDSSYVQGIANVGEQLLLLMDIESLLSSHDMGLLQRPHDMDDSRLV